MKPIMKTSLKAGLTAGLITVGSMVYALTEAGNVYIVKIFEKDSPITAKFFKVSRENMLSILKDIEENTMLAYKNTTETVKKRYLKLKDKGLDGGLDFGNGHWFTFDDAKGIHAREEYKCVPGGQHFVDLFNNAYLSNEKMAVEMFDILKQIDDNEDLDDATANQYIFILITKYVQKKTKVGIAYRSLMDDFKKSTYWVFYQKLDEWDGKDIRMDLDNDDWGDDLDLSKENAELDKKLADAKAELQKSLTQGKDKLLVAARAYVAVGGNPAEVVDNWEELSKKYNITPDDLK